jgi:uncharacterized membrane protein YgaE (UPF0421/DUF939 family)
VRRSHWQATPYVRPVTAIRTATVAGLRRLRDDWLRIVEATFAAAVAWAIAVDLLEHQQAFFAPAAALIVLGVTRGQRLQRAVEIVIGVAVGILLADVITSALGRQSIAAIVVLTTLSLTVAILLGGGPILAVQATVSAVYVAVVAVPDHTLGLSRFTDALVGGAVALVVNQLPLHRNPVRVLLDEASQLFDRLATVQLETADALQRHDPSAAQPALEKARGTDAEVAKFREAINVGYDAIRLDPWQRRRRQPLFQRYEHLAQQLDYAVRNTRVLARNVVAFTRSDAPTPEPLPTAIRELAEAVRALRLDDSVDDSNDVREHALNAVRLASSALEPGVPLAVMGIVWQVRSTAVDLLLGTGMELAAVLDLTDAALQ